jgi:hypothetical protein
MFSPLFSTVSAATKTKWIVWETRSVPRSFQPAPRRANDDRGATSSAAPAASDAAKMTALGHCQVDEKPSDEPPRIAVRCRYEWNDLCRSSAIVPQLDNASMTHSIA